MEFGVFTGDLHEDGSLRVLNAELSGDWKRSVRGLCTGILQVHAKGKVRFVVLPGDVFDDNKITGDSNVIMRWFMEEMNRFGITVYYIQGNHDFSKSTPLMEGFGAIHLSHLESIDAGGITLCGVDYNPDPEKMRAMIAGVPPCDILVIHSGFDWNLGFESVRSLKDEDFPAHVGKIYAGHVHTIDVKGRMRSLGGVHPSKFDETGRKALTVVNLETREESLWDIKSRKIASVEVRHDPDLQDMDIVLAALEAPDETAYGRALLVKLTSTMAAKVADYEKNHPDVVFCRSSLSEDVMDPTTPQVGTQNVLLSDAVPMLLAENRPELRSAALQICGQGGKGAMEVGRTLAAVLKDYYRGDRDVGQTQELVQWSVDEEG